MVLIVLGYRCPFCCKKSKGEEEIDKFLRSINVNFEREYRIKECKDKKPLPFDFKVNLNNSKYLLIEYQGDQHFRDPAKCPFSTVELKRHDDIKKAFCDENNINLLVIPYWDYEKIEEIISTTIEMLNNKVE